MSEPTKTVFRTCTLCEAACGLRLEVSGDRIGDVRGDADDVLSRGFVCPKGVAIGQVHHDPDRLRTPMLRVGTEFQPIGWEEAFDRVTEGLRNVQHEHGKDAVAVYMGNPIVHNTGALLVRSGVLRALGTKNSFSAGSQDTSPRFAASHYLYGSSLVIPVPDLERTSFLLCLGANPVVSNGSFLTAPDMKHRLRAMRARGGRLVVVDPRKSETAREADEHVAIRPGGDAALLLAMIGVLITHRRVDRAGVDAAATGWDAVREKVAPFTPERVSAHVGIPADVITRLALELADAQGGAAYARVGVCNNRYGTVASWAVDVLNLAAGQLGRVGGSMFATPAVDLPSLARFLGDGHGRWKSRVRGLPETLGDLPGAVLAEEMETEGKGQVRALLSFAGNPVLSLPNGRRVDRALARLDFMASIDLYVNETTRHASVILPPAWSLTEEHVETFMHAFAVRNVARYSPRAVLPGPDDKADWEILLELATRLGGGPTGIGPVDFATRVAGRLGFPWNPMATVDMMLRLGPRGDHYLPWSRGLSLERLRRAPHGIDLGPLEPGIAHRVFHRGGRMRLDSAPILAGIDALLRELDEPASDDSLQLIGRRDLRSNNSWMHNIKSLVSGKPRCQLYVHPDDAARLGLTDGGPAHLESRVHRGQVTVRVTDEVRKGVVSLPHGWGHSSCAAHQHTASETEGVSANDWTDDAEVEFVVGQSILNGVPVRLYPA